MKVIIDRQALRRRATIAHTASLGGLLVLLGSVAVSLWSPEFNWISSLMLFAGGVIAMGGIFYANRWVKKPRPEFILDQSLKGLSDQHRLYHYTPFAEHLMLTPNGMVVLETVNLEGQFTYKDGRWKQKMTAGRAMRYIVEERLGNPIADAQTRVDAVQNHLLADLLDDVKIPVQALVVFTHPMAVVKVDNPPMPVFAVDKLAKKIPHPGARLPNDVYAQIRQGLDGLFGSLESSG